MPSQVSVWRFDDRTHSFLSAWLCSDSQLRKYTLGVGDTAFFLDLP